MAPLPATTVTGIRAFLMAVSHSLAQSEPIPLEVCLLAVADAAVTDVSEP